MNGNTKARLGRHRRSVEVSCTITPHEVTKRDTHRHVSNGHTPLATPKEPTIRRYATHDLRKEHGKKEHGWIDRRADRRAIEAAVAQGAYIV